MFTEHSSTALKKVPMQRNLPQLREPQSRRHFLQMMGAVTSATLLAACSTFTPAPEQPTVTELPAEKQTLIFWGDEQHPINLAAAGFMAAHPEIEWQASQPTNHVEKMKIVLVAGVDQPDLYWVEAPLAQRWGCLGQLTELTEQLTPELANYHPAKSAESLIAPYEVYIGWPADLGVSGWYYRQDRLQALGWQERDLAALTWPAFIEMTAALREQGLYSFCFPPAGWPPLFFLLLHQMGGSAVSQDGATITVGDEKGIHAMHLVKQLWEAGGGLAVDWQQPAYWQALKEGKLMGDFAPAWVRRAWETNLQNSGEEGGLGEWRIAPLPGGNDILHRTGVWGGGQLVIPKVARNPEGALQFMHYALASQEGATLYGAANVVPAYHPYLTTAAFTDQRSVLFGDWSFGQFWAEQEQELSPAYVRPAGWDTVNSAVQQEMMAIVFDSYSVEDGMSRIVERALPEFRQTRCQ
ncbi:MAG: extracellular solute-binding protein [Caldilinea sp. CFX5]|nr:extracellular solute-binding protein [Caldilinea sp. CFX5]